MALSTRLADLRPSPIRQILSVIDRDGMVSFAGGLPAAATFPDFDLALPPEILQYGPSEGDPELRAEVAESLTRLGIDAPPERVMILSGSQQGIDLVAKLFIDPGTPVALEAPTYLAALQAFRFFGAAFTPLRWDAAPAAPLAYVVPTFANPTGRCATDAERRTLGTLCGEAGVTLFEDDPYRDLVYGPADRAPVVAGMAGASWIYQGSFSKTMAPGLRLGFLAASDDLFAPLVMLKQASDLHSSRVGQHLVLRELRSGDRPRRLSELAAFYAARRDTFEAALRRHLGGLADWRTPQGGLFFWLRLRHAIDTRALLAEALDEGVAFMPGEDFYPGEPVLGTMRLNFSHASPEQAERGLATLASLLRARETPVPSSKG